MEKFEKNGITVIKCEPLNWVVENEICYIGVGDMGLMRYCVYYDSKNIVSIDGLKFRADTYEEASEMVQRFADGMEKNLEGSIYKSKP